MKNTEFHKPFIKDLFIIGAITIFSIVFVRFISVSYSHTPSNTLEYTSQKSQVLQESRSK